MRDSKKDKWLTTFGDLMALLFALFVLLISFSEINSLKYKSCNLISFIEMQR